jgi:hypothetical protein
MPFGGMYNFVHNLHYSLLSDPEVVTRKEFSYRRIKLNFVSRVQNDALFYRNNFALLINLYIDQ